MAHLLVFMLSNDKDHRINVFCLVLVFKNPKHVHIIIMFLCGSVVEHCISSAKGCGFDSQGTHILMKMYNLNANVVALDKSVC